MKETAAMTTATTIPEPPATAPTGQPLLDLSRLVLAIRRRRRMWVALALVGMLAGAALAVLLPAPPTAIVRLYVVHEDDQPSDSGNLIRTDIALMDTAKIAGAALKQVGSAQRPEDFLKDYDVVGVTNNVLEVTVRAKTNADAVNRAKALADVFIADHIGRIKAGSDAEAKALTDQRNRVQAELKQVNKQISTAETQAQDQADTQGQDGTQSQPNAAGLDSLYARRAELTSRVSDLSQQAEEAGIGAPRVAAGTQIVDAPRALKVSRLSTLVANSAIGLLLGLIVGWMLAALTGVVKDRPVLRKDIAANLGASVIAQLPAPRRGLARLWRGRRTTRERRRVAGTVVRLVRGGSGPVSVLELGTRRIAAALTLDVATELATDREVVIVEDPAGRIVADDLPGRDLGQLTGRADRPIRIIGAEETTPARRGETRLGIGSVTPGTAWTDLRHLGTETLLVVRTGYANTAWLHTVARQLADSRIPILGIVLVNPDPRDKSDGTLWDSLHTALRGRARQATPDGASPAITPARAPEPAPARTRAPAPEPVPPLPKRIPERTPEPVAAPEPAIPEPAQEPAPKQAPRPAMPYPAPVPAGGVNGAAHGNAEPPTKRFAPVQPHPANGNGAEKGGEQSVHDLPTKRFAPVRPEDVEELVHRRTQS